MTGFPPVRVTPRSFLSYWLAIFSFALLLICTGPILLSSGGRTLPRPVIQSMAFHWSVFAATWMRLLIGLRIQVKGRLPDRAVVVAMNHQSAWETFVVFALTERPFVIVLKNSLLRLPLFGYACKLQGHIGIDRDRGVEALRRMVGQVRAALKAGEHVLIFPQGTRVDPCGVESANGLQPHPPRIKRLKGGAMMLARLIGAEIVPVGHNSGQTWSSRRMAIRPGGAIRCVIGRPLRARGQGVDELAQAVQDQWERADEEIRAG